MRCFFIVEHRPDGVLADARLDVSQSDTMAEHQEGTMFRDWLLSVIGVVMDGTEDAEADILHGRSAGRRRVSFSYRRNVRGRAKGETPYWEMELPGDVVSGKCPDEDRSMFTALASMFLRHSLVRPGRGVVSLFSEKGIGIPQKPTISPPTTTPPHHKEHPCTQYSLTS